MIIITIKNCHFEIKSMYTLAPLYTGDFVTCGFSIGHVYMIKILGNVRSIEKGLTLFI